MENMEDNSSRNYVPSELSSQQRSIKSDQKWFVRNWVKSKAFRLASVILYSLLLILATWGIASWHYNKKIDRIMDSKSGLSLKEKQMMLHLDSLYHRSLQLDANATDKIINLQYKIDSINYEHVKKN